MGRSELNDDEVRDFHARQTLLFENGGAVPPERLALANGMFLSLDLRGDANSRVGYRARDNAPLLDLTQAALREPSRYWEPVLSEEEDRIVLTPQKFYLLMSDEAVSIPSTLAANMTAYDPTSGELRTHYAGFFDPGFGYDPHGSFHGSRAALEVRAAHSLGPRGSASPWRPHHCRLPAAPQVRHWCRSRSGEGDRFGAGDNLFHHLGGADDAHAVRKLVLGDAPRFGTGAAEPNLALVGGELGHESA